MVRRLTAAAGVEGRPVEHDPALTGVAVLDVQHRGVPLAQGLVVELESMRTAAAAHVWTTSAA
jgi:hypothetical protein